MKLYKKILKLSSQVIQVLLLSILIFSPSSSFAQTGKPSVNCPVSVNDQARVVASYLQKFSSKTDFDYFYKTYTKFLTQYNSVSGDSYYTVSFDIPNQVGWSVSFFEMRYEYPIFPNGTPTKVYPNQDTILPTAFSLNTGELDKLNTIYKANRSIAPQFMNELLGLRYFESVCSGPVDIYNIPKDDVTPGKSGYGKVRGNSQSFTVVLDADLWARTTADSIEVHGLVSAQKEVTPKLKVAYGKSVDDLNKIAPEPFFNSPMNIGDKAESQKVTISGLKEDETYYVAVVDADNQDIAYTETLELTAQKNDTGTNYYANNITEDKNTTPTETSKDGLVPCGQPGGHECGWNDAMEIIRRGVNYIFILMLPIMAIMITWIGFLFMKDGMEARETAKKMLSKMITGVALILCAWLIVNTIFSFLLKDGRGSCYNWLNKKIANCSWEK